VIVAALAIISVLAVLAWEIVNVVRLFRRWRQRPPATTATRFFQSWQIALRLYVAAFIGFFALVGLSLIPRPPNAVGIVAVSAIGILGAWGIISGIVVGRERGRAADGEVSRGVAEDS